MRSGEQEVISFVLRFCPIDSEEYKWRIKVTHVQEQDEFSFSRLEEAVQFIEKKIERKGE